MNIWSHGLGALAWLGLFVQLSLTLVPKYEQATIADALAVGTLFMSVVVCFTLSSRSV